MEQENEQLKETVKKLEAEVTRLKDLIEDFYYHFEEETHRLREYARSKFFYQIDNDSE